LEVLSECAAELNEFEALDCAVEEAGEGGNANNKTGCCLPCYLAEVEATMIGKMGMKKGNQKMPASTSSLLLA
jgi:hypothetical protein